MDSKKTKSRALLDSAVMVLQDLSTQSLILTKRSANLRHHPGEICFPGGKWEPNDFNLYATALRELYEELGVRAERVQLIKSLSPQRTLNNVLIHPWYGTIKSIIPYQLDSDEVEKLLVIPMHQVQEANNYKQIVIHRQSLQSTTLEFVFGEEWVWGATAKIMSQLII